MSEKAIVTAMLTLVIHIFQLGYNRAGNRYESHVVIPFLQEWNEHFIPGRMEWLLHSCRNGMITAFLQEWNDQSIPPNLKKYAPWQPFLILRAVERCRWWVSALSPLGWYFLSKSTYIRLLISYLYQMSRKWNICLLKSLEKWALESKLLYLDRSLTFLIRSGLIKLSFLSVSPWPQSRNSGFLFFCVFVPALQVEHSFVKLSQAPAPAVLAAWVRFNFS